VPKKPEAPEIKDGFRKRRKRAKGWLEKAIKDGSVRDPKDGPNPPETHSADATVVAPDVATIDGRMSSDGHP
jgi:hypothetical protein